MVYITIYSKHDRFMENLYFHLVGYAIMQNVSESILGILVAVSAIVGVLGSVAYPFLKK